MTNAISNCDGNYLEFELRFDREDDPPGLDKHNREQRKKSIKELISCVENFSNYDKDNKDTTVRKRSSTTVSVTRKRPPTGFIYPLSK